jgi:hypothetical protein
MSRLSWIEKKKQPAFEIFLIEFNFNAFQITWKLGVIIFGSVLFLSKKVTKPKFFFKKKPKPGQTDRFRFGSVFYGKNRFKPVWLGFSRFSRFFRFGSVFFWVFFSFGSVRVFRFSAYKTETEPKRPVFSKF